MSAFAVKVSSDKQTLILAGEAVPPRVGMSGALVKSSDPGVTLPRVTVLVLQGDYAVPSSMPAVPARSLVPYLSPSRALSAGAALYARTQNLPEDGGRSQIIDTYA
jgi:hypothetical protein